MWFLMWFKEIHTLYSNILTSLMWFYFTQFVDNNFIQRKKIFTNLFAFNPSHLVSHGLVRKIQVFVVVVASFKNNLLNFLKSNTFSRIK